MSWPAPARYASITYRPNWPCGPSAGGCSLSSDAMMYLLYRICPSHTIRRCPALHFEFAHFVEGYDARILLCDRRMLALDDVQNRRRKYAAQCLVECVQRGAFTALGFGQQGLVRVT